MRKSEEFGNTFPFPDTGYIAPGLDHDLGHLLQVTRVAHPEVRILLLLPINPEHAPSHLQWVLNVLLHLTWANRIALDYGFLLRYISMMHKTKISLPLNAALDRFLVWCIFLGSLIEEEALKIQDKSYDIPSFYPSHH